VEFARYVLPANVLAIVDKKDAINAVESARDACAFALSW
jgi:hypothetical protein